MNSGAVVWFNVGGKRFATSLSTLESRGPANLLAALARGESRVGVARDVDGAIFVDRNPKLFAAVLDYFRGDELPRDASRARVLAELRYYGVEGVLDAGVSDVSLRETLAAVQGAKHVAMLNK